jgi:hypothetical protein
VLRHGMAPPKPSWRQSRPDATRAVANSIAASSRHVATPGRILAVLSVRMARTGRIGFAAAAIFALASARLAQAQDESAKTKQTSAQQAPLPPTRPTDLPSTPIVPQQDHPVKEQPARDPSAGDASLNPSPYRLHTLPPATRARMHECGIEWQRMKAAGAATEKTWYTFAQTCLTR